MDFWLYLIPSLVFYIIYYYLVVRRTGFFSVDNMFILSQLVMFFGTVELADKSMDSDEIYIKIYSYGIPLFIFSAYLGELLFNRGRTIKNSHFFIVQPPKIAKYLLIFSIVITVAYYFAVGYNVFFVGVASLFSGESQDVATLRLGSYAGSRYLFPGYVNQFKNSILPALSIIYIVYLYDRKNKWRLLISIFLAVISLIGVAGTGQRAAFVLIVFIILGYMYFFNRQTFFRSLFGLAIITLPLFFLFSVILGRNDARSEFVTNPFFAIQILINELMARLFNDNQNTGLVGFRYIAYLPTQHGSEWLQAILGLLPGSSFRGSTLSNEIFQVMYGSDRGTSPVSLWGSFYYNFGYIGTYILPLALGLVYKYIYSAFSGIRELNHGQVIAISGVFVTMGTWVSDGPVNILNTGILAYMLLFIIFSSRYFVKTRS